MKRRPRQIAREKAMIAIYQHLLVDASEEEIVEYFNSYKLLQENNELMEFCLYLYKTTIQNMDSYKIHISKYLKSDWTFDRLSYLEQAILLLAACELLDENLNKEIVINEAILLAKSYLDDNMYKYINGVLTQLI